MLTWIASTVVDVGLTMFACEASRAFACEAINSVDTSATVEAWITKTFIRIHLAKLSCVAL